MPGSSLGYGRAILMGMVGCWPLAGLAAGLLRWEERGTEARPQARRGDTENGKAMRQVRGNFFKPFTCVPL